MKRYISTLLASTVQSISARIIISYYSRTRKKSQRYYDSVMIRVGGSVVQISRLPAVELRRTLHLTLTALVLLPSYIGRAAHLNPDKERLLDFLSKARFLRKVKTSITRLNRKSILSLMDESTTSSVARWLPIVIIHFSLLSSVGLIWKQSFMFLNSFSIVNNFLG